MSMWSRLWSWLRERLAPLTGSRARRRARAAGAEADAPGDPHTAYSRATGGVPDDDAPDQHSTTGTTPTGEYVGRVAGEDPGSTGPSGAEKRSEAGEAAAKATRPQRRRIVVPPSRRS